MIGIYKITSPSGKIYIGQSENIEKRFRYYKSLHCKMQIVLYRSFIKHGVENHIFEIIEECDKFLLNNKERYWQDFYNVLKLGLNCLLTSTKDKKKVYSEQTLNKMSTSLKGRIITKEWRENLSKAGKGRKLNENQRNALLKANTGRFYSKETRDKISFNRKNQKVILDIETGVYYYSVTDLARNLNVNASSLYDFMTNRKKSEKRIKNRNISQYKLV